MKMLKVYGTLQISQRSSDLSVKLKNWGIRARHLELIQQTLEFLKNANVSLSLVFQVQENRFQNHCKLTVIQQNLINFSVFHHMSAYLTLLSTMPTINTQNRKKMHHKEHTITNSFMFQLVKITWHYPI